LGGRQQRMIKEFWKALGIDPETTPDHLTLGEIGMESMFAVELQQELEREFNITIGLNYIKLITIKMLKDYEAGNVEEIHQFINEMKIAREKLIRYKFVFPTETHTLLNNVKTGKPVYTMPPYEVTYSVYDELARKINRPFYGLNFTRDMCNFKSMKEISNYYIELMKKLEPKGNFDCVGYLDGSYYIAKMVKKGMLNKAIVFDIDDEGWKDEVLTDEIILEYFLEYMARRMPKSFTDKIIREMNTETEFDGKMKKFCAEIKDFCGRGLISTDLEPILSSAVKRTHLAYNYQIKRMKKFNKFRETLGQKWLKKTLRLHVVDPLKTIKESESTEQLDKLFDMFKLSEVSDSQFQN
jgi:acyl carrier protein